MSLVVNREVKVVVRFVRRMDNHWAGMVDSVAGNFVVDWLGVAVVCWGFVLLHNW